MAFYLAGPLRIELGHPFFSNSFVPVFLLKGHIQGDQIGQFLVTLATTVMK
jgi:hypothetical protein